jgi:hypothetical protein
VSGVGASQMSGAKSKSSSSLLSLPAPSTAVRTSGGAIASSDSHSVASKPSLAGTDGKGGGDDVESSDADAGVDASATAAVKRLLDSGSFADIIKTRVELELKALGVASAVESMPEPAATSGGRAAAAVVAAAPKSGPLALLRAAAGHSEPRKPVARLGSARRHARRDDTDRESESDNDADAGGGRVRRARGDSDDDDDRMARTILRQARKVGTLKQWVSAAKWKSERNRRECESIAYAVDAFLADGVSEESTGMEILLRRMAGVTMADDTGKWGASDAIEWNTSSKSLLPRKDMRRYFKDAATYERYVTGGGAAVTAKAAFDKSKSSNWRTGDQSVNPKKGGNPKPAPPATAAGAASK